jgi:hypothetical protein
VAPGPLTTESGVRVEIISTPRRFPVFSPFGRSVAVLLAAGFVAYQLGKGEVAPSVLLVSAAVVALVVAIQLVPRGPFYSRKPERELEAVNSRMEQGEPALLKRAYSPPHLTQFESREFSELAWESSSEDNSFRLLRPFYLVYPRREFTVIAASLKFQGDKDHRSWQPVANSAPPRSHAEPSDEHYEWILIGYVTPNVNFDATLKLRNSQSKLAIAVLRDLVAAEDRPFQSVHLRIPATAEQFVSCPSGAANAQD